jgi:hypothetical protein
MSCRELMWGEIVIGTILAVGLYYYISRSKSKAKETYIDPIFNNERKMKCDDYPRSNGSIYGEDSDIFSGYPFYDKAY